MHPYRPLYELTAAPQTARPARELTIACAVLLAVSAIQIASGAQVIAGVLGLGGALAGFLSTRRS
jgi:hypothetical protein